MMLDVVAQQKIFSNATGFRELTTTRFERECILMFGVLSPCCARWTAPAPYLKD